MSKHSQFSDRPQGRIRRDDRRSTRNAKRAFAYMGGI